MAIALSQPTVSRPFDLLSGAQRAHALDRWIYLGPAMAAGLFVAGAVRAR